MVYVSVDGMNDYEYCIKKCQNGTVVIEDENRNIIKIYKK